MIKVFYELFYVYRFKRKGYIDGATTLRCIPIKNSVIRTALLIVKKR